MIRLCPWIAYDVFRFHMSGHTKAGEATIDTSEPDDIGLRPRFPDFPIVFRLPSYVCVLDRQQTGVQRSSPWPAPFCLWSTLPKQTVSTEKFQMVRSATVALCSKYYGSCPGRIGASKPRTHVPVFNLTARESHDHSAGSAWPRVGPETGYRLRAYPCQPTVVRMPAERQYGKHGSRPTWGPPSTTDNPSSIGFSPFSLPPIDSISYPNYFEFFLIRSKVLERGCVWPSPSISPPRAPNLAGPPAHVSAHLRSVYFPSLSLYALLRMTQRMVRYRR
ncbi:hypothetical protein SODALDRAFT_118593 [Sodiomyces alkalinus F11]|uniref:Uncharacterized protein n=1 Tax=Sodiomyces alkalinus (strain CBS 110278 / VKM F-3762 / F11) TaxID=1314773 RepID=A0A3N2Q3R1_SODAK|nr:hypothetical protein SODALDRAFT_118593 [Sodiomyces alkalinus F11]ROT41399.1 hypothetical protein SODALDRAFT_118593 [Sodiomyces alkalinus F11]